MVNLVGGGSVINWSYPSSCRTAPATPGLLITGFKVKPLTGKKITRLKGNNWRVEFYQKLPLIFSIPKKQSYQLTVLFNSAWFSACLWLACGLSQYFVCLFISIFVLRQSCKERNKNISGGVNNQHEAIGSILKHQEVFESFRRFQEASGRIMKAQHQNNNKQTNKIQWLWCHK